MKVLLWFPFSVFVRDKSMKKQRTVTRDKNETVLKARDRHNACIVPRAVPIVEAMVALVIVDQLMAQYAQCNLFPVNRDLQEPLVAALEPEQDKFKFDLARIQLLVYMFSLCQIFVRMQSIS
ncbi:unnamed protein product [Sphenostylis stenocarpa]|uniref:chorismate synthase n=1 Tax=Sphenostylis stenocarpa TaxID=92480 RepID=A0AA86W1N2_9FABA|nr:unnamed protein product [Sphenostylis stenocarpa]